MTTRIIKKQDAVFDGSVTISKNSGAAGKSPAEYPGGAGKISARVVDKTADFLVIEIICPCGRKSFIKCQYSKNQITDTEKNQ
ncbi:MAG: hypothetical protein ACYC3B_04565 [Sedimentisphaerales bacterium]